MRHMTNVLSVVNGLFTTALRTLHPEFEVPKSDVLLKMGVGKFGDYRCNTMALAQVTGCRVYTVGSAHDTGWEGLGS